MTTAASGHCPIAIAPMTATDINKLIVIRNERNAWNPLRSVSRPPSAIAASASTATSNDCSSAPAITATSEPTASTPAATVTTIERRDKLRDSSAPSGSTATLGRIPNSRIAASIGSGDASS